MIVVLDTSTLLFWLGLPESLSQTATRTLAAAERIVVSGITIWEIGWKAKLGKLELPDSIDNLVEGLRVTERVELKDVSVEVWLKNVALEWDHRDPADRTIVATACLLSAPLLTSDQKILSFYDKATW